MTDTLLSLMFLWIAWSVWPSHQHKWTRWSDVRLRFNGRVDNVPCQDRTCTRCGYVKRRWLT